jgi:hypothetical protein
MRRSRPYLAAAAAFIATLLALPAGAAFHFFTINEAYSNASGTLQYVELTALAGGQQFTQGHTLVSSAPGQPTRTFNVGANLPGDTSGRKMLFGTAGMQGAFGVTPDYIIPDGFLHTIAGTINWGEGSDVWNHPAIPTDGVNALDRGGSFQTATPQNFAGVTGTVPTPTQTFQALWWASPAGSESGWGVNIAHQGNTLFATWFTYDTNGDGMWLVMDNGVRQANGSFTGTLYRTTGNSFSTVPFNGSTVAVTAVGNATFTFSSATTGTFAYTVNNVSQTKNIVRQEFSAPVPSCTPGGTAGATPNYQDLWWKSPAGSENGWGINLIHQGDTIFATWFTYGADQRGMWLVMDNLVRGTGQTFTGPIYRTRGNPFNSVPWVGTTIAVTQVGTVTLAFTDANNGTFTYTVDGVTQSRAITRQVFSSPASVCKVN